MFTDIVGSTELAAKLGDRGWKALVARHNSVVRRELKRFAGRELDTAGDGFFVMFERPAQAIDCAWAVIDALRPLDIQIRAAVHMGEVEVMGGKVGGIAVHAASRVLSLAKPGHIYVTGIVRDVVAGSDIRFTDEGVHELRGVPGEWRLFAVEEAAVDGALPVEAMPEPEAARRSWAPVLVALGVGAVLTAIGIAFVLASSGSAPPVVPHANGVLRIDPAGNRFVALVDIDDPTAMAVDGQAVWVLSLRGRTATRIDQATGTTAHVGLPAAPTGIAVGDGGLWITTGFGGIEGGGVLRIGLANRTIETRIALGDGVGAIAIGDGTAWVANRVRNVVSRIDLTTRAVGGEIEVGEQPEAIAIGEGSVWVANAIDRTIWRIDPASMSRTTVLTLADAPYDLALGFGRLWVTSSLGNSVTVIDVATNTLQRTLAMPGTPRGIAAGSDAMWVAITSGQVVRIDPQDPEAFDQLDIAGAPEDVVVGDDGTVWVSIRE
jgi:YVTN family beta-propeller protein